MVLFTVSLLSLGCAPVAPLSAQTELPSVSAMLEAFEAGAERGLTFPSPDDPVGSGVVGTLTQPDRFPAARVDSIQDGLERLASDAVGSATRSQATRILSITARFADDDSAVEAVRRLDRIYRRAHARGDLGVQRIILLTMPQQPAQDEALAFLESVGAEDDRTQALMALTGLSQMGPRGVEALNRLDSAGSVANPSAREALRRMVEGRPSAGR